MFIYLISYGQLIAGIEERLGKTATLDCKPFHAADMMETWADITKAGELLGWEPKVSLEEGLDRTTEWFHANRELVGQIDL